MRTTLLFWPVCQAVRPCPTSFSDQLAMLGIVTVRLVDSGAPKDIVLSTYLPTQDSGLPHFSTQTTISSTCVATTTSSKREAA